jgi:hypothetical protein
MVSLMERHPRPRLVVGLDGWPANLNDPIYRAPSRAAEQIYGDWLHVFERSWADGSLAALADAVQLCRQRKLPLPDWVADGVLQMLAEPRLCAKLMAAEHRNNMHYTRWDAVRELRDRRGELTAAGYRPTWNDAYCNAAEKLAGTKAAGSPTAMAKSYQKVEKLFRVGRGARFRS